MNNEFIEKIKNKSIELCKQYNILPSLMIAQACLESGFGKHAPGNNLFGYKWTSSSGRDYQLLWTYEYNGSEYVKVQAKFRKYNSIEESLEDYAKLIGTAKRYAPVRACRDYKCAAKQVKACGYATGHQYDQSIIRIIEQYNLTRFDMKDIQLTKNFKLSEFQLNDPIPEKYIGNIKEVATQLQKVRDILGKPIIITSGYRSPAYNKKIGGATNSQHLYGKAADTKMMGINIKEYIAYLIRYTNFNGFGIANSYVHCDTRPNFTVWVY
jgi:hypothetical protein